jgi:hypothetical protein
MLTDGALWMNPLLPAKQYWRRVAVAVLAIERGLNSYRKERRQN